MSKLLRYTQSVFGASASANQMGEYGSKAAGSPLRYSGTTITPAIVQTLSQYLSGWFAAVIGVNSPCIEDMNALCYLFAYQIAYGFQAGIAEWDSGTTYFIGSLVNSSGTIYVSLVDNNLNNAVSTANWVAYNSPQTSTVKTTTYAILASDTVLEVSRASSWVATLPDRASVLGRTFLVFATDNVTNYCRVTAAGSDTIADTVSSTYFDIDSPYQNAGFYAGASKWLVIK